MWVLLLSHFSDGATEAPRDWVTCWGHTASKWYRISPGVCTHNRDTMLPPFSQQMSHWAPVSAGSCARCGKIWEQKWSLCSWGSALVTSAFYNQNTVDWEAYEPQKFRSIVLQTGSPGSGCEQERVRVRTPFQVACCQLLSAPSQVGAEGKQAFHGPGKGANPTQKCAILRTSSRPNSLLTALPPSTVMLGLGLQHSDLGEGDINIQAITDRQTLIRSHRGKPTQVISATKGKFRMLWVWTARQFDTGRKFWESVSENVRSRIVRYFLG